MPTNRKYLSREEALLRLQRFCSYRDRCHSEVRTKLIKLQVYGDILEEIIAELIQENFLNEERFARSFVRGKFRMNQWGRNKIVQHLKARQITEYNIRKGLEEIDPEEYFLALLHLVERKKAGSLESNPVKLRKTVSDYVTRRGFEFELITKALDQAFDYRQD